MLGLQDIENLGFLGYMGILTKFWFFFKDLEATNPPIFKCSESNGVKKNSLIYHHLEDIGV